MNKEKAAKKFVELLEIMEILRSEEGCPWDRKQTHDTLKPYIIEEAYEVVESVNSKDYKELAEELGDVLLQIVFHAQVASENNNFEITDILDAINDKMIRRHPHVFGDAKEYSYEQWENLKSKEKNKEKFSKIGNYKKGIPPLLQLRRLFENSLAVGFDPFFEEDIFEKIIEDAERDNIKGVFEKIVYLSVKNNEDIDSILSNISKKYYNKFQIFENILGNKFNDIDKKEKKKIWDNLKEGEV
ncbi:nucleoside triphosphate pyrophosphohydrolase/pyrophosphatase MazG [Tepiditoga spiralis]|uniref:Nucleoside triphosphate pyrophosphohydrolase/pyrophosphatase MazG n=1 Tax=Tepiditoga spiralis TaxID=2108365 RepID=A0A7G1G4H7_9BACT|nr:MazG family protein [Tepiditoga spiralis]BBE31005.1 nucleoside triphosphate pyrophosphohydrolase/pyrophosphatase MazG [Tepiditoga spiralis]